MTHLLPRIEDQRESPIDLINVPLSSPSVYSSTCHQLVITASIPLNWQISAVNSIPNCINVSPRSTSTFENIISALSYQFPLSDASDCEWNGLLLQFNQANAPVIQTRRISESSGTSCGQTSCYYLKKQLPDPLFWFVIISYINIFLQFLNFMASRWPNLDINRKLGQPMAFHVCSLTGFYLTGFQCCSAIGISVKMTNDQEGHYTDNFN